MRTTPANEWRKATMADDTAPPHGDDDIPVDSTVDACDDVVTSEPTTTEPEPLRARRLVAHVSEILAYKDLPVATTGFSRLDAMSPMLARTATVEVGCTGSGKTSLALQIARHHATRAPVLYVPLELTEGQLTARVLSQVLPYSWRQVLGGALEEREMVETLEPLNIWTLPRTPRLSVEIERTLDHLQEHHEGMPMLVIDYLQLIRPSGGVKDIRQGVNEIIERIMMMTEGRDMVTLMISRTSRQNAKSMRDARGHADDFTDAPAESSAIEYSAANEWVLTGRKEDDAESHDVTLQVAKSRFGRTGKVGFRFHGASGRWEQLDDIPIPQVVATRRRAILKSIETAGGQVPSRNQIITRNKETMVKGSKSDILRDIGTMIETGELVEVTAGGPIRIGGAV